MVSVTEEGWVWLLVRALPWASRGRGPTTTEADQLAAGLRMAKQRNGLCEAEVRDYALNKLARADSKKNPVSYVIGAFRAEHLDRVRPAGTYEPLAAESLSLPADSASETNGDTVSSSEFHASESTDGQQPSEPAVAPEATAEARSSVRADLRELRRRRNLEQFHRKPGASDPDQESA